MILLASGGPGSELLSIWGRRISCTLKCSLSCAILSMHVPLPHLIAGHCSRDPATSLLGEKSSFSACCLCHRCWVGSDLLHEAALLWACTGEIVLQLAIALLWQCQFVLLLPQQSLQVLVPESWIDSLLPGVRTLLEEVQARNARLQSGKRQADDKVSDRAAEGFLQTALYSGICFWQNLPFRTQRWELIV